MNPREQRELERQQREEAKKLRLLDAQERQRKLDEEVYGKGSMLIQAQKSSAGGDARGGIWDVSTSNYKQEDNNQQNQNNDIDQRGIDLLGAGTYSVDSGEEAEDRVEGIELHYADETSEFLPVDTILEDLTFNDQDWNVEIEISNSAATKSVSYETGDDLYDDTGSNQTYYHIPIYRDNQFIATYGAYQEGIRCVNGEPVVEFYKI